MALTFSSKTPVAGQVILGLGSNKPCGRLDSIEILEQAVKALGLILSAPRRSSLYKTAPQGVTDQPPFFNMAVSGGFQGSPKELLSKIHKIEKDFGRDRSKESRWGQRSLDIDILLFGEEEAAEPPLLELPHPRLTERRFALEPLLEICPGAVEPGTGRLYRDICAALPDQGVLIISR
jgi:2-amino-4-hydroxy-6-hydroxymethyldihydropteridine diphosphokinase